MSIFPWTEKLCGKAPCSNGIFHIHSQACSSIPNLMQWKNWSGTNFTSNALGSKTDKFNFHRKMIVISNRRVLSGICDKSRVLWSNNKSFMIPIYFEFRLLFFILVVLHFREIGLLCLHLIFIFLLFWIVGTESSLSTTQAPHPGEDQGQSKNQAGTERHKQDAMVVTTIYNWTIGKLN